MTFTWVPSEETIAHANLTGFIEQHGFSSYDQLWRWSVDHRDAFWKAAIDRLGIAFAVPPTAILDDSAGPTRARWLPGAALNIVDSCFLYPATDPAVIHRSRGRIESISRGELRTRVDTASKAFHRGQRVGIAMPMTLEAVVAYLAVVKAGATVVSIADSFSTPEIASRLRIGKCDVVITQDVVRRAGRALPMAEKVWAAGASHTLVVPAGGEAQVTLRPGDRNWAEIAAPRASGVPSAIGPPDRYLNILFSSGTTGEPKAVPWTHLTPIKAAMDGHFHQDIHRGDVVCWPTNLGWMMGPWLIFASLINGAAMALFGDAPTGRGFGTFVRDAGITVLGVIPSLIARWRESDCLAGLDWSGVRVFSSTGETSNPSDVEWLLNRAGGRPMIDYCGGTELGGAYVTATVLHPCAAGSFNTWALGMDVEIRDDAGLPANVGEAYLVPPSIGLSTQLLNADHDEAYHNGVPRPGLRRHGDRIAALERGYYRVLGRSDDTMNLGGIKVGSAEIEGALADIPEVRELAAVGLPTPGGGPDCLVVVAAHTSKERVDPEALKRIMQGEINRRLNPLFKVAEVIIVEALPRTASNKVMRREIRNRLVDASPGL